MSAIQIRAFHRHGDDMVPIAEALWTQFVAGAAPLPESMRQARSPAQGVRRVDVLLVTSRDGECELIEPVSLRVDAHGYLLRMYLQIDEFAPRPGVLDARRPFLERYLRHAHRWSPTAEQFSKAIASSCATPITQG